MANTHVRAHQCSPIAVEQTLAFSPANASLPFLWLSTIDLFCCPPCYEGTGRRARPPILLCLAHILYSFCFLFYFLFVILPPSVLPLKLHSPLPLPSPLCLSCHIFYLFGFHFFLFSFPAPLLHLWLTNYITAPHFDKPFLNSLASFLQSNQTPSVLMIRQPQIFFSALPLSALLFHYLTPHFIYPSGLSGEAIRTETRHWLNSLCTITSALCV